MGGRGRGGGKRGGVSFTKPPEPAFLRRMKEQIGYKEKVVDVDTKVWLVNYLFNCIRAQIHINISFLCYQVIIF